MAVRYYYYYSILYNLFKPEHEYYRLEWNSIFVCENIPSPNAGENMVPLKSLQMEFPWRVTER
jgi:hypothetical protein